MVFFYPCFFYPSSIVLGETRYYFLQWKLAHWPEHSSAVLPERWVWRASPSGLAWVASSSAPAVWCNSASSPPENWEEPHSWWPPTSKRSRRRRGHDLTLQVGTGSLRGRRDAMNWKMRHWLSTNNTRKTSFLYSIYKKLKLKLVWIIFYYALSGTSVLNTSEDFSFFWH